MAELSLFERAPKFTAETVSDQKRLVRGEHWLMTRSILRARDCVHSGKWKILTLAGGAPTGEIAAIRELMPRAVIVAVDRDKRCLEAAIDAGADDVVECELADFESDGRLPNQAIAALGKFDAVNLDLCAGANRTTRDIASVYFKSVVLGGVFLFTFSYGRDVIEAFNDVLARSGGDYTAKRILTCGASSLLCGRILYIFKNYSMRDRLSSVMVYRGSEMPMCSLLFQNKYRVGPVSYIQVEPGDFELAVSYPDPSKLYDCPQERIESLRRRFAAIKASITRRGLFDADAS